MSEFINKSIIIDNENKIINGFYILNIDNYKYFILKSNDIKKLCILYFDGKYQGYAYLLDNNELKNNNMLDISKYFMINEISNSNIKSGLEKLVNHYNNSITIFLFNYDKNFNMKKFYKFINKYLDINYTKLIYTVFNEPNCDFCKKLNEHIKCKISIFNKIIYKETTDDIEYISRDVMNSIILNY
jgi:hypothetical protein